MIKTAFVIDFPDFSHFAAVLALSLLLFPSFVLAMTAGAWWFRSASELFYRRVAYLIVAAAALVSLPAFDGIIR